MKPVAYHTDSFVQSKLLVWVPSSIFQNVDHYQMLIIYLSQGNFYEAFKSSFLLKVKPTDADLVLAPY